VKEVEMASRKKETKDQTPVDASDDELDDEAVADDELDLDDELVIDDELDEELDLDDDMDVDEEVDDEIVLDDEDAVVLQEISPDEEDDDDDEEAEESDDDADEADDVDDDEVESALDDILRERFVVAEVDDEEEVDESGDTVVRVKPRQPDEFVCQSCFLVKSMIQLADSEKMFCRDCV
jgi:hypothetical protein